LRPVSPIAHPGPPRHRRPSHAGCELVVHPQRALRGVTVDERRLVCLFLKRYVVWCARARRIDRIRNAVELLAEVAAATPARAP